ncbi:MAG: hypothetical protein QM627_02795, partial [Luteolibacter sp.]
MKPKHIALRSRSFPSRVNFCFGLAASLLAAASVQAADQVHNASPAAATVNWTELTWSPAVTDWTSTAGDTFRFGGTTASTVDLDTNIIVGGIANPGAANRTITATTGNTITMDGAGLSATNQVFGNAGVAYIANNNGNGSQGSSRNLNIGSSTASVTINMLSDLNIGITSGTAHSMNTFGVIVNTSGSAKTLTLLNNLSSGSGERFVAINSSVGVTGSAIDIVNAGTGSRGAQLLGTLGSNVTSITQNSATSRLIISGDNSTGFAAGTGTLTINDGLVTIGATTSLGIGNLIIIGTETTTGVNTLDFNAGAGSYTIAGINGSTTTGLLTTSTSGLKTITLGGSGNYSFAGAITASTPANLALTVALTGSGSQTLLGA